MNTQTLTTDFTENELVNLKTPYLVAAKRACSDKITFHQSEINTGHCNPYHIEQLKLYVSEFIKWVPIVRAAQARDKQNDKDIWGPFEDDAYLNRTGLQG